MGTRLTARLEDARQRRFVGRQAELELFQTALMGDPPDFAVLHLYGPGGVGKSTLVREYARLARGENREPILLDGRHLDASPAGFMAALQAVLPAREGETPLDRLAARPDPVLLIDTYELLAPLDRWLREEFLPHLPERALVVFAGRQPPSAAWRADGGWGSLTRIVSLRNLRPDESRAYLDGRGVPRAQRERILGLTYGHPLALSLAVDLLGQGDLDRPFELTRDPNVVRLLLERFAADVPDPINRQALEVCAHAFTTDENLLTHCLGEEHAYTAFQWLRGLSFIEQGPFGLFPHDLAREALEADLRWRNVQRFREVHFQVRSFIIQRIMESSGLAQQYAIYALLHLHRNNPFMRPFYQWQQFGQLYIEPATAQDFPAIEQMVRRHQGEETLALTHEWWTRSESAFYVFRAAGEELAGFAQVLALNAGARASWPPDPALVTASSFLDTVPALAPDDTILYFRNWMDAELYQSSPAIFNMAAMISLRYFFNTPRLAYSFICQQRSEAYADMFAYLRMPQVPSATFVMDDQQFGVFAHDWRAEPVLDWMAIMGERELLDEIMALEELPHPAPAIVLSEPEFNQAVRQALKDLHHPLSLAQSPLLRSRCLRDRTPDEPTPAPLQSTLRDGAATLLATPKGRKLHRVLWHTYFEPAPTQEAAAELLDLPFSTYRYQLGKAVDYLVGWLWQQEVYGPEA